MLRTGMLSLLAVWAMALFSSSGQADEKKAKEILNKAIRAVGGDRAFGNVKAPMMWMERGTYYGSGEEGVHYIGQYASKWPNWYRQEIEGVFTITVSGNRAWMTTPGDTEKLTKAQEKERLKQVRIAWATRLFPLRDKAYKLAVIDGVKVNGRETVGIKASHKDGHDIKLYFDKDSGLITKLETMAISPEHGPKPVLSETYYSNHRYFGGVRMPSKFKVYYNKKLYVEAETVDCKVRATLDPKHFEPPKK